MHDYKHIGDSKEMLVVRESYAGRMLTETQFYEAVAIGSIIEQEIKRSGKFKEKLSEYSHAFASGEKFDAIRAETIVRDLFKERTGQTMNQMRAKLMDKEAQIGPAERDRSLKFSSRIEGTIEAGNDTTGRRMTFNRAFAIQAQDFAMETGITETCAKSVMGSAFKEHRGTDLYEWGKGFERQFYTPLVEADRQRREAMNDQTPDNGPARTGPSRT